MFHCSGVWQVAEISHRKVPCRRHGAVNMKSRGASLVAGGPEKQGRFSREGSAPAQQLPISSPHQNVSPHRSKRHIQIKEQLCLITAFFVITRWKKLMTCAARTSMA